MNPPSWLPANLRAFFVPEAPKSAQVIAGPYAPSELWMLEKQAADNGTTGWVIAPMWGDIGTFRLSK